jgi:hypothetical protein
VLVIAPAASSLDLIANQRAFGLRKRDGKKLAQARE